MDPLNPIAERVLDLVERIPPGKVMAYGDIAEYLAKFLGRARDDALRIQ